MGIFLPKSWEQGQTFAKGQTSIQTRPFLLWFKTMKLKKGGKQVFDMTLFLSIEKGVENWSRPFS